MHTDRAYTLTCGREYLKYLNFFNILLPSMHQDAVHTDRAHTLTCGREYLKYFILLPSRSAEHEVLPLGSIQKGILHTCTSYFR